MLLLALIPALIAIGLFVGTVRLQPPLPAPRVALQITGAPLPQNPTVTPLPRRVTPELRRAA